MKEQQNETQPEMMSDIESMLFVMDKLSEQRFKELFWQSVTIEQELLDRQYELMKANKPTDKIDNVLNVFYSLRNELNQYRTAYTQISQRKYEDRIKYEKQIADLQNEINILKFDEL